MASTGLERGDPSSSHEIPQMVVAATVPKGDPHHLLAEEQAAAATLSSLMPYVSASSGTSQPSWPPAQPTVLAALQMAASPQSLTFIETPLTPSSYSSSIAGSLPQEANPSNLLGGVPSTDSSRYKALKSLVHSIVTSRLEEGVAFSQHSQHTVSEVIVTVKQVFPEFSDSVIHGLIVAELKLKAPLAPCTNLSQLSCAVVANGDSGRTDSGLVTLRTVPDHSHTEEPPAKKVKGEIPPSLNLHPKVPPTEQMRKGVWSATYGMCSLAPPSPQELTGKETTALKQLIRSYRESAGFLLRAAEQLEQTLPKPGPSSSSSAS